MNRDRRKRIQDVIDRLNELKDEIETIKEEEEEYRDNMPENLQGSARYEAADEAANNLDMAADEVDTAMCYLEDAKGE